MFTILSVSINVMQFAGGLSQIRPVNAIPAPVGLVFGPVGAVACALGNLLGDLPNLDLYGGTIDIGVSPFKRNSFETWQDSNFGTIRTRIFDIIPLDGIYHLLYICIHIHHVMCLDINGNTAQEADALTNLNN